MDDLGLIDLGTPFQSPGERTRTIATSRFTQGVIRCPGVVSAISNESLDKHQKMVLESCDPRSILKVNRTHAGYGIGAATFEVKDNVHCILPRKTVVFAEAMKTLQTGTKTTVRPIMSMGALKLDPKYANGHFGFLFLDTGDIYVFGPGKPDVTPLLNEGETGNSEGCDRYVTFLLREALPGKPFLSLRRDRRCCLPTVSFT
eukprot:3671601-Amphidinium_carterae.1